MRVYPSFEATYYDDESKSHVTRPVSLILEDINTETLFGVSRCTFYLQFDDPAVAEDIHFDNSRQWIEGIGCISFGFGGFFCGLPPPGTGFSLSRVVACSVGGKRIYSRPSSAWIGNGKRWLMQYDGSNPAGAHTEEYRTNGDVDIYGRLAYRLEHRVDGGEWSVMGYAYAYDIRSLSPELRMFKEGESQYTLLCNVVTKEAYDRASNSVYVYDKMLWNGYYLESADTVESCGIRRTRYKVTTNLDSSADAPYGYWIEGVGFSTGFGSQLDLTGLANGLTLLQCYEDGRLVYEQRGGGIYTGVDALPAGGGASPFVCDAVYDLHGRRLQAEPAHGLYIKNGHKVAR